MNRFVVSVMLVLLVIMCGLPAAVTSREAANPDYTCLVDSAPGVERATGESFIEVRGRFTTVPLGLECRYVTESGDTLVVGPGWLPTAFAGIALAAFAALVVITAARPRHVAGRPD